MKVVEMLNIPPSKAQKDKVVQMVGKSQPRFDELMRVFIRGPYRVTQRAAWVLSYCVESHPGLLRKHFNTVTKSLENPHTSEALQRNLLRTLQFVKIPTQYQGRIANCCFTFLTGKGPIAVKVFAMTVLANLAKDNTELKNEIIPILSEQLPYGSAGYVSRAKRVLRQLKQS